MKRSGRRCGMEREGWRESYRPDRGGEGRAALERGREGWNMIKISEELGSGGKTLRKVKEIQTEGGKENRREIGGGSRRVRRNRKDWMMIEGEREKKETGKN